MTRNFRRPARLLAAVLLALAAPAVASPSPQGAQSTTPAGALITAPSSPTPYQAALFELRDAVYMDTAPEAVLPLAKKAGGAALALGSDQRCLAVAVTEYLMGRSYNEHGAKAEAISRFEASEQAARQSLAGAETAAGLLALSKALSELCRLKDLGFLLANGPSILKNTKRILELEPEHVGARLIEAQSKAFAPGIFGGAPQQAIALFSAIADSRPQGLEKDELFDLRVGMATAFSRAGNREEAIRFFNLALELYPSNAYAREQKEKAGR